MRWIAAGLTFKGTYSHNLVTAGSSNKASPSLGNTQVHGKVLQSQSCRSYATWYYQRAMCDVSLNNLALYHMHALEFRFNLIFMQSKKKNLTVGSYSFTFP